MMCLFSYIPPLQYKLHDIRDVSYHVITTSSHLENYLAHIGNQQMFIESING